MCRCKQAVTKMSTTISALLYKRFMVKICGGAELNFWCEFSFNFVSSDSALDFYIVNLFLAENLRFCSLEIKAGKSNFYIFHNVPP